MKRLALFAALGFSLYLGVVNAIVYAASPQQELVSE
jgi:hypothetical protein